MKSGTLEGRHFQQGAIGNEAIQSGAVTADKILSGSIKSEHLEDRGNWWKAAWSTVVKGIHLAGDQINSFHLQEIGVKQSKLEDEE